MLSDLPLIKTLIDLGLLVVVACSGGFTIWDRRNRVTQAAIKALQESVSRQVKDLQEQFSSAVEELRGNLDRRNRQVDEKIENLRSRVSDVPSHKDVEALYTSISTLAGTVNQLVGETRLQSDLMRMIINREVNK